MKGALLLERTPNGKTVVIEGAGRRDRRMRVKLGRLRPRTAAYTKNLGRGIGGFLNGTFLDEPLRQTDAFPDETLENRHHSYSPLTNTSRLGRTSAC